MSYKRYMVIVKIKDQQISYFFDTFGDTADFVAALRYGRIEWCIYKWNRDFSEYRFWMKDTRRK